MRADRSPAFGRTKKRPGKPEALHNKRQFRNYLRCLLLLDGVAVADRDDAGLFRLWNLAYQIDMQESVLKLCAFYLNEVGELERALEGAGMTPSLSNVVRLAALGAPEAAPAP